MLKINDTVNWRGAWGHDAPKHVKVIEIEINCINKSGTPVDEVKWDDLDERTIVGLDNGHWAYGDQLSKV